MHIVRYTLGFRTLASLADHGPMATDHCGGEFGPWKCLASVGEKSGRAWTRSGSAPVGWVTGDGRVISPEAEAHVNPSAPASQRAG